MASVRFEPYFRDFEPLILNGAMMQGYFAAKGATLASIAAATTVKATGRNASSFRVSMATGAWVKHDRTEVTVRNTNTKYGLERELGGAVNPRPERSLYRAMQAVATGRPVATPQLVGVVGTSRVQRFFKDGK